MRAGGFLSRNVLDDALTIATVETGVPVVAFDDEPLDGPLGLRLSGAGRAPRRRRAAAVVAARSSIADAERSVGVLFARLRRGAGRRRRRRPACGSPAVQVKGVPDVSVDEALWTSWRR